MQACNKAVTRIKQGEEEVPSASVGCAACSLAPSQRWFLALLVGGTTEIGIETRPYRALCTPLIFLLYKVRVIIYFQKRGRGRGNESKRAHVDDCRGLLKPRAWLLLSHAGCLISRLHHAPRNVRFEECLPRQVAGGGGVLAVKSIK